MNDDPKGKGLNVTVVGTGASNMHMLAAMAGQKAGTASITDPISDVPIINGTHGKAWLCNIAEGLRQEQCDPADDATVAHWLVEAPPYHPAWHSYSIYVMHLRPLLEKRRTLFYLDGATHEIWVYALDPTKDRRPMLANGIPKGLWMTPLNYAGQFIEVSDDLARERVRKAVEEICTGRLSPDTDFRDMWAMRFGDHMLKDRPRPRPPKEVFA